MALRPCETATLRAALTTELYFRDARRDTFARRIPAATVDSWIDAVARGGFDVTRLIDRRGYAAVNRAIYTALRDYSTGALNAN